MLTAPDRFFPSSRRYQVALLASLLAAVALRVYAFRGFGALDDAAYAQLAHRVAQGTFTAGSYSGPAVFPLRVGIIYPTALLFRLLGVSEWTMVLFPFCLSILSVLLAYVTASYCFGPVAGLFAAGLWAILPLDVFQATILVPDLPAAFFASLGILGIILLSDAPGRSKTALFLGGAAAGLAFGISWLSKESVAYLVPFCAILFVTAIRKNWRHHLPLWTGVAVGSGVVLLAEMLVYYRATGDWLFHVHETERNYHQYPNAFFVAGSRLADPDGGGYSRALVRRLLLGGPMTIFRNAQFLYLPLLAGIVSLHAAYRRDRRFLLPALWFVSLVLMFNFFSSSFSSYVPLVLFDRYLYPILLPGIVLVAGFLTDLFRERRTADQTGAHDGRFWGTLVLAGLLLAALDKNYANRKYAPGWASASRHVAVLLKPSDRIYTDVLSIHGLEFFWSYPPQLNTVDVAQANPASAIRTGDYVLVNSAYLDWLVRMAGWWPSTSPVYRPPESFRTVPSSWNKVWNNETAVLYRVE